MCVMKLLHQYITFIFPNSVVPFYFLYLPTYLKKNWRGNPFSPNIRVFTEPRRMVLMTMIARVFDGLPLAASVQEDEQTGK